MLWFVSRGQRGHNIWSKSIQTWVSIFLDFKPSGMAEQRQPVDKDDDNTAKNTPDTFKINFITWAQQFSGEAAHGADTPVSTSRPSDSKDLHLISTEEEVEEEQEEEKRGAWKS